ncbi:MFS transporter [Roseibium sp. RKSG952]|uniref:MFS transporter n=1 Tax=Roseibium sp. RKSG952 TaxID=2529384 RepID=UPI0018AD1201|nr:MFS transporter [Roseibium sp. RKSG952]
MRLITEKNRRWWLLWPVSTAIGLVLFDGPVVGVALETIQSELGLSETSGHWVVNAYLLSFACFVAVCGKIADQIGLLKVFLFGLAVFAAASVIAGFAGNGFLLIAARAVQGIGGAILFPLSVAMTTVTFPKNQRGMALGLGAVIATVFMTAAPFIGGVLTEFLSWRWIFWVTPPIAIAIAVFTIAAWRDAERPPPAPIDWTGLLLLASGMFCVVFALMEADRWGWDTPAILLLFLSGAILLIGFVLVERHKTDPLIEVELFTKTQFAASNLVMIAGSYAKMPIIVFAALYAQQELGLDAFWAGVLIMVSAIPEPFAAPLSGYLADRIPPARLIYLGLGILFVCMLVITAAVFWNNIYILTAGLFIGGFAFPTMFLPAQVVVMEALPEQKHGMGGSISMTAQSIGGTVSIAVSSAALSGSGDYPSVFAITAGLTVLVYLFCLYGFRTPSPMPPGSGGSGKN